MQDRRTRIPLSQAHKVMFVEYPDMVNIEQLRKMLGGLGRKKIYALIHSGELSYMRAGKGFMVPKISVIQYVLKNQINTKI